MKLAPQLQMLDYGVIEPSPYVDPTVYAQSFSPEFPLVLSPLTEYEKTSNASVMQRDELAGYYSTGPEIPKSDLTPAKILGIIVGTILVYKFILKKG